MIMGAFVLPAQSVTGPVLRIPHHQRILEFFRGGDGSYYLFMSSSGSMGRFSREGESNFVLRRFGEDLSLTQELRFRRTNHQEGWPENVYAAFPTQRGLGLISLESVAFAKSPVLRLYQLEFQDTVPIFHVQDLALLPEHTPGLTNPQIRLFEHPSVPDVPPHVTLSWRHLNSTYDNTMGSIFLEDQGQDTLVALSRVEFPFKKLRVPVRILEIEVLDHPSLLFRIEGHEPGTVIGGRSSSGAAFLWQFPGDTSLFFRYSTQKSIPLSFATQATSRNGVALAQTRLTGFYASSEGDSLSIGRFEGYFDAGDTLHLQQDAPTDTMFNNFVVQRYRERSQLFSYRRVHQDWWEDQNYVTHFIGAPVELDARGKSRSVVPHSMLQMKGPGMQNAAWKHFYQSRYEEYGEINGFVEIEQWDRYMANMLPDDARNRRHRTPALMAISSKDIGEWTGIPLRLTEDRFPTIPAPQFHAAHPNPGLLVMVARFRKNLRLIQLDRTELFPAR